MITQEFNINLVPGGVPPQVYASQYDDGSRMFVAHVFNDKVRFKLDNSYTIVVCGTKPNDKGFRIQATVADGAVCFPSDSIMTTHAGNVRCSLEISKGGEVIHTLVFFINVAKAALSNDTELDQNDDDDDDEEQQSSVE